MSGDASWTSVTSVTKYDIVRPVVDTCDVLY